MSSDLQPLLEWGLVSWAGGRGVIHPTPPPSNPSSHQWHFERHPWRFRAPPTICWRDMLDHGDVGLISTSWKKKNDWIFGSSPINFESAILTERFASQFFSSWSSPCVECQSGDPTSLIALEAGFVFTVQKCSSKIPYLKLRLWRSCLKNHHK